MEKMWFQEKRSAWMLLSILWFIAFSGKLSRFVMAVFQVQIADDFHIARSLVAGAWSTNLLITAFCAPIGGMLVDKYGAKKVLILSSLFNIVGAAVVCLSSGPIWFYVGYGVISGFAGIGASTSYVLLFQWFKHHRGKATAILTSASSIGLAICTPIFVSNTWLTWQDAFLVTAVLGLITTLPLFIVAMRTPDETAKPSQAAANPADKTKKPKKQGVGLANFLKHPLLFIISLALFTCGFNMGTVEMNLVTIHQINEVSPAVIAFVMSLLGIMEITGVFAYGYVLDRMNKNMVMALLYTVRIAAFFVLFLHLSWSPHVFAILFGITYLSAIPGGLLIANDAFEEKGKATGILIMFHQAGGIIGALVSGIFYDMFGNYQMLLILNGALCVLVACGYYMTNKANFAKRKFTTSSARETSQA
ncbi:MFS transporter [Paenibacillus sp. MMS18-CY102]|nr:MFS transporter [Paenibacillus sp. MMS18-CY102]